MGFETLMRIWLSLTSLPSVALILFLPLWCFSSALGQKNCSIDTGKIPLSAVLQSICHWSLEDIEGIYSFYGSKPQLQITNILGFAGVTYGLCHILFFAFVCLQLFQNVKTNLSSWEMYKHRPLAGFGPWTVVFQLLLCQTTYKCSNNGSNKIEKKN